MSNTEETNGNVSNDRCTSSIFETDLLKQDPKEKAIDIDESIMEREHDIVSEGLGSNQFLKENFAFGGISNRPTCETHEEYFCRICQEKNVSEPNISPCNCRGTMGLVHRSCLEQWLAVSDSEKCEVCGFQFTVRRQPKYNIFKALTMWFTMEEFSRERLLMVSDGIGFLTAVPLLLLANHQSITLLDIFQLDEIDPYDFYITFQQPNLLLNEIIQATGQLTTFLIIGAVSFLDVFCIGWLCLRVHRHFLEWYKWYRTQCDVHLILPESQ